MSSKESKSAGQADTNPAGESHGFLEHAFKSGISAAEDIHKRAFEIPLNMLEGMGAPQDKIDMIRDKSQHMIVDLYSAINSVAHQFGPFGPESEDGPDKSK